MKKLFAFPRNTRAVDLTIILMELIEDFRVLKDEFSANFALTDGVPVGVFDQGFGIVVINENVVSCVRMSDKLWGVVGFGARSYSFSPLPESLQFSILGIFDDRDEAVACAVCASVDTGETKVYVDSPSNIVN